MVNEILQGVIIDVETFYQPEYSNPHKGECMFAYRIRITNQNPFAIQLLSRQWYITDSDGSRRDVSGDGVVGEQPVIKPFEQYQYVSGCNLNSEFGTMEGFYTVQNLDNKMKYSVTIPRFVLQAPYKLN